jgi:D-sedoheptulose 7-phosphate isomerase
MTRQVENFSRAFYPFLYADDRATQELPQELPQELIEGLRLSLVEKARESGEVKSRFFAEQQESIVQFALELAMAFHHGHRLLVCGNGGSATDAQHVAVEFMHPITVGRKALPVVCLNNDMATVTAVANDVGFADVFARQIIALGNEGDVLLGISTSGNSENIVHAFETARRMKLITAGFAGGDGGRMAAMHTDGRLDFCLTVPTASIHRVQEAHLTLYHIIWDLVHELLPYRSLLEKERV